MEDGLRTELLCGGVGGDISWGPLLQCPHSAPDPGTTGNMVPELVLAALILVTPHSASSHEDAATVETTADSLTLTHEWKG